MTESTKRSSKGLTFAFWQTYVGAAQPHLAAIAIFLTSRLVMLLAIYFAARHMHQNPIGEFWNANSSWYHYLLRYDAGWYLRIAREGYSFDGNVFVEQPVIFYPLYPLLSRFLFKAFSIDFNPAVLIVANLSILAAIPLFGKLLRDEFGKGVALLGVAFISFFPASLFFSSGYTESLTFLLIVGFFLLLRRQQFILASCVAGLTLATRSTGIVLLLPLLWELWRANSAQPRQLIARTLACVTLATAGLWIYMIFLWHAFGDPFAFVTGQQAWMHGNQVGSHFVEMITLQPFSYLTAVLHEGPTPNTLDPWFFLLFFGLIVTAGKRLRLSYKLFGLGVLLLPYVSVSTNLGFRSFTRYAMLAFPAFVVLGKLCQDRRWLALSTLGVFAAMLFMYTALFAQWYWAG